MQLAVYVTVSIWGEFTAPGAVTEMCPTKYCGQVVCAGALTVAAVGVMPAVPLVGETDNHAASLVIEKLEDPVLIETFSVLLAGVVPAVAAKDKLVGAKISVGPGGGAPLKATINSAKASEPLAVAVAVGTPVAARMLSSEKAVSLLGELVVSVFP
jgi:hypothetical protein